MTSSVPNVVVLRLVVDNGLQSEGSNYFPGSLIDELQLNEATSSIKIK